MIVGTYVHTFDLPSRSPRPGQIPAMRPSHEHPARSSTPIYDALYAEYRRLFRALPGDRSGEDELRFSAFEPWTPEALPRHPGRHRIGARPALPPGSTQSAYGSNNRMLGR